MTVEQALEHSYIKEFKNKEVESKRGRINNILYIETPLETLMDDNHKYSIKEY